MTHFMPFHTHMALALQFIALVSGVLLLNKASAEGFFCKKTGKIIGGFVVIATILSIVCTLYLSIRACCHRNDTAEWHHPQMGMSGMPDMPDMPSGKK